MKAGNHLSPNTISRLFGDRPPFPGGYQPRLYFMINFCLLAESSFIVSNYS